MKDTKQDKQIRKNQEDFGTTLGGGVVLIAALYGLYKLATRDSHKEDRVSSEGSRNSDLLYRLIREGLL